MSRRVLTLFAALSLSLHILVPPGFMPASVGDGWFLKWCPDGMPAEVIHALFGHAHHHHAHDESSFEHCELSGLTADVDFRTLELPFGEITGAPIEYPAFPSLYAREARSGYLPRAPPAQAFT